MKPTLLALLVVLTAGCQAIALRAVDATKAKAIAISALSVVRAKATNADTDTPDTSDECQNCNGTGKIGDGRIVKVCPICKGTGKKVDSQAQEQAAVTQPETVEEVKHEEVTTKPPEKLVWPVEVTRKLTMYTRPGCQRCKEWLIREQKTWESMGFEIVVDQDTEGNEVPWFLIEDEEIKKRVGSPLTWTMYSDWRIAYRAKYRD